MESRKITVVSTRESSVNYYESAASTFGELKGDIPMDNMSVVVKETRNTLSLDEAVLPEGPFTIFLSPTKVKSGANYTRFSDFQISDMREELLNEDTIDFDLQDNLVAVLDDCMRGGVSYAEQHSVPVLDVDLLQEIVDNGASGHLTSARRAALQEMINSINGTIQEIPAPTVTTARVETPEEREKRELLEEARGLNL
jgi:hypothetical protein